MILLNFSHPITNIQQTELERLTAHPLTRIIDLPVQMDNTQPFVPQVTVIIESAGLTTQEWQSESLLVNLPGYAPAAATILAEIHGRTGYFPAIVRIRPIAASTPPQYEVAEIVNLQAAREQARIRRTGR